MSVSSYLSVCLLSVLCAAPLAAQGDTERIHGVVSTDQGAPIAGALVTVSDSGHGASTVTTDERGRFTLLIHHPSGRYAVAVIAIGQRPFRTVARSTGTGDLTVDATMAPVKREEVQAQALEPVHVVSERSRPEREQEGADRPGDHESALGFGNVLAEDGDLSALSRYIPGMRLTPNGLSVLGTSPDQTLTAMNGLSTPLGSIPRGVADVTFSTASFDPSVGGYSGGSIGIRPHRGGVYTFRSLYASLDAPSLQASTANAALSPQKFGDLRLDFATSGPLGTGDGVRYNGGVRVNRQWGDLVTLDGAGMAGARGLGLSADSLRFLTHTLADLGLPSGASHVPRQQDRTGVSTLWRLDWESSDEERLFDVVVSGDRVHDAAVGAQPNQLASAMSTYTRGSMGMQLHYSTYVHHYWLNDTRLGWSARSQTSRPYFAIPRGTVLAGTASAAGVAGVSSLAFGGGMGVSASSASDVQLTNETEWTSFDGSHRGKLALEVQYASASQRSNDDPFGTYYYASLADLQAGAPASFRRTLGDDAVRAGLWRGGVSIGDVWIPDARLRLQYGLRLDVARPTRAPGYAAAVDSIFRQRTDRAPSTAAVSPRLGFVWLPRHPKTASASGRGLTYFTDEGLVHHVVRGGIGRFVSTSGPDALFGPLRSNGTPGAQRQLGCYGSAVPAPDWSAFAHDMSAIPGQCATAGGVFSDSAPMVQLFGAHPRMSESWRSVLSYGYINRRLYVTVDAVYSLALHQPNVVDLNFSGAPQFTLAGEANRHVYVPPTDIDAAAGVLTTVRARRTDQFSSVIQNANDGRALARQITFLVAPLPNTNDDDAFLWWPTVAYTLGQQRSRISGFTQTTDDDPRRGAWSAGNGDVRHQFQVSLGVRKRGVSAEVYGMFWSGMPYTPMVGGDVNGDGYANDRAFVFDQRTLPDSAFRASWTRLLHDADGRAARCLARQVGTIAAQNSCRTPWSGVMSGEISLQPGTLGLASRLSVRLEVENILGGLDRAVHGANGLHGWGGALYPDPTLLVPTGFDPATHAFRYAVNPNFGVAPSTRAFYAVPFTVTLKASIRLNPTMFRQTANGIAGVVRRSPSTARPDVIKKLKGLGRGMAAFWVLLDEADSLGLTQDQMREVQRERVRYTARVDSMIDTTADALLRPDVKGNSERTVVIVRAFVDGVNTMFFDQTAAALRNVLTPEQRQRLSSSAHFYLYTRPRSEE